MFCINCGSQMPDGTKFCSSCGNSIDSTSAVPPQQQYQAPQQPQYQAPPQQQYYQQPMYPVRKKKIGCLIAVIIAVLLIAGVVYLAVKGGGEFSFTTAKLTDITMTTGYDQTTFQPIDSVTSFSTTTKVFYVATTIKNAPDATKVNAKWYYLAKNDPSYTEDIEILSSDYITQASTEPIVFSVSLPSADPWPVGEYMVVLSIDDKIVNTTNFTVQ